MTRMKTIALIDTRLEVVSQGILVSTHPDVMAAFAANDAFQKAEASGRHIRTLQGKPPLEELVKTQASSVGLREAVMACVSGRESRIFWSSGAMKEQNEGRVAVERSHYR